MKFTQKNITVMLGAAAMALAGVSAAPASAQDKNAELVTMLADRAAINDLLVDYFAQIGTDNHDFRAFFVPNGRLDVNGWVVTGYDEIRSLYDAAGGGAGAAMGSKEKAAVAIPRGRFDMLFSNLKVTVTGNTAVATLNWYSVLSEKLIFPPAVTEYGRERTELVKKDGKWLITDRKVISDGGMPDGELKTYKAW